MKRKSDRESACRTCEFAELLDTGEHCLCSKRGVVYSYGVCRRYREDLTKFSPAVRAGISRSIFEE